MGRMAVALVVLVSTAGEPLLAFTSIQKEQVRAIVQIGQAPPGNTDQIRINHQALFGISNVTQMAIIQGEAGINPVTPTSFNQRITSPDDVGPNEPRDLRVFLEYRFIPRGTVDPTGIPFVKSVDLDGPDPMAFAFQIEPTILKAGSLEYRITAQRLPTGDVVRYPIDGTPVRVGVDASASNVIGPDGGRIVVPDGNPNDGQSSLSIPARVFSAPTTVSLNEVPLNHPTIPPTTGIPNPVSVYRLDPQLQSNSNLNITLKYPDFIFPFGQDGKIDGSEDPEYVASLAWWDGFEWRKIRGQLDPDSNTITSQVGFFQFLAIIPSGAAAASSYKPSEKVITPNGDGINDTAMFSFGSSQTLSVKIFDMSGHRIRDVSGTGNLSWDGRDTSGKIVESGVYIYQYDLDGETVSGLIAVVK